VCGKQRHKWVGVHAREPLPVSSESERDVAPGVYVFYNSCRDFGQWVKLFRRPGERRPRLSSRETSLQVSRGIHLPQRRLQEAHRFLNIMVTLKNHIYSSVLLRYAPNRDSRKVSYVGTIAVGLNRSTTDPF